jgi:hypothetical protein
MPRRKPSKRIKTDRRDSHIFAILYRHQAMAFRARVLQTYRDGPAFYELAGMIDDRYARYLNLALPISGAVP